MTVAGARCALLTPPGRGAIATIGVRGSQSLTAVAKCFQPASGQPLSDLSPGRIVFGRFQFLNGSSEDLVVGLISSGQIDVHCHGGSAAAEAILAALVVAGCELETWREWATAEERDPIAAAALVALADARTERTSAILLDQYHGALRRAVDEIRDLIAGNPPRAVERLHSLLARSDSGRHLTTPWRVVLTGAPNVGKSSLINALLGYQRAIVYHQPGTTRDVLTATTAFDGWPVELADTAGLREGGDTLEAAGVTRARRQLAEADLVVEVRDVTADAAAWGQESGVGGHRRLLVLNKCDLLPPPQDAAGVPVSAKTGQGIDVLIQALVQRLVPIPPSPGAAVPFTAAQFSALEQAEKRLARGNHQAAQEEIQSLTPAVNPEI
jgi:tRNA modification GTPase